MLARNPESVSGTDSSQKEDKCRMPSSWVGDKHWSEKMEGEARTIECLRGRLLAERAASKAAREETDLMGEKLIELERQLKLEMESRNRVEKKLKYATKKLKSLKLSAVLSQSSSPEKSEGSTSSSTVSLGLEKQEEKQTPTSSKLNLGECYTDQKTMQAADAIVDAEDAGANCNSASNSDQASETEDGISAGEAGKMMDASRQSSMGGDEPGSEQDETSNTRDLSLAIVPASKSSTSDLSLAMVPANKSSTSDLSLAIVPANDSSTSNLSLAIVPASIHQGLKICEPKFNDESQFNNHIHDVLVALQQAKKQLQTSMERMAPQSRSFELCGGV